MAKRLKKTAQKTTAKSAGASSDVLAKQVMDSAQKIWLAGLGAFAKAQEEGGKVFETLVQQGQALEQKTRAMAGKAAETARAQATESFGKATGTIDKLDQVFQDRVHRSLNKLGVLTAKDIDDLTRQVTELSESVRSLVAAEKSSTRKSASPRKPAARKPAAKSTVAKVTATAKKTARSAAKKGMKQATKAVKAVAAKLG
ncbi:MAG: phasin family protein [Burkholderiales bacterium]|nr:phasin family protein [Burkholderiales bacterium]